MKEKTINTRLKLKYDTYGRWTGFNPLLLKGEVAIATVEGESSEVKPFPSVVIKVGDGINKYVDLPIVSALAADVYSWAKQAKKPTYSANEIEGLSTYIAGEIDDTNTIYQIVKVNDYKYKLQEKERGASLWTDTEGGVIEIPKYDDTNVKVDIATLQTLVGEAAVATQIANAIAELKIGDYAKKTDLKEISDKIGEVETGKTVVQMIDEAKTSATYDDTELKGKIDILVGEDVKKSARVIASEEVAKIVANADTSYDTLKEIADWISTHKTDATAMNSAITALEGLVGETSVSEQIQGAITALKIGDYAKAVDLTALAARVKANEDKLVSIEDNALFLDDTLIFDCGDSTI